MSNFLENSFLTWLSDELATRMAQKLEFIKINPRQSLVIDADSSSGLEKLRHLYPKTVLFSTTPVVGGLLNVIKNLFGKGIPKFFPVSHRQDNQLDLADAQIDLLWVNSWRFSHDEPWKLSLNEWHRVLRNDGLLMFSYLGPDTGKELRQLSQETGMNLSANVLGLDMHDMGDGLVGAGFADPVMDMEYLTLTYEEADLFIKDARSLGLLTTQISAKTEAQIQQLKGNDGLWRLTIEVVYGHAWWAARKSKGIATIRPEEIKVKSK